MCDLGFAAARALGGAGCLGLAGPVEAHPNETPVLVYRWSNKPHAKTRRTDRTLSKMCFCIDGLLPYRLSDDRHKGYGPSGTATRRPQSEAGPPLHPPRHGHRRCSAPYS
eukprot:scaffold264_cov317-Pinguiococcus_pyrenoidosus.AAC.37